MKADLSGQLTLSIYVYWTSALGGCRLLVQMQAKLWRPMGATNRYFSLQSKHAGLNQVVQGFNIGMPV